MKEDSLMSGGMMSEIETLQKLLSRLIQTEVHISLWKPIEQQSNQVYSIRFDKQHWVAKVFLKPEEFEDAPRREFAAMRLLAQLDIAPKPIHYEQFNNVQKPIVIYEYMEGEMWDRRSPSADELRRLAGLWLRMNQASVKDLWLSRGMERTGEQIAMQFANTFQRYSAWTEAHFPEGRRAAALLQKLVERRAAIVPRVFEMKPVLCFSRADPRFANVIERPEQRLGMIDWEDSGLRDAARDVADIVAHPNQEDLLSWEAWQAFLAPYFAERRKVDAEIEQRVHLYNAIFPVFWLSGLISLGMRRWEANRLGDWTINSMNPNERLRRYLARAIAWPAMDFEQELDELGDLLFF
jgi:Ser/Thr protein kinase RdoA (MazF antagonist)